jgi:hypothetical protein
MFGILMAAAMANMWLFLLAFQKEYANQAPCHQYCQIIVQLKCLTSSGGLFV